MALESDFDKLSAEELMDELSLLIWLLGYLVLLYGLARWRSRKASNQDFFVGGRQSSWLMVAFGMIGTSLSGVTFISVPGSVGTIGFSYLQIVLGHFLGYAVVAFILIPIYYREGKVSIYAWIESRVGLWGSRMASVLFIVARTLGASARLYLVLRVLQDLVFGPLGLAFELSSLLIVVLILLYTQHGGVKTIVFTDCLQTATMLAGLICCLVIVLKSMSLSPLAFWREAASMGLTRLWGVDPQASDHWIKQILAGAAIALAMTGMDQEMMQKTLSVAKLKDAQKNMMLLALCMQVVVFVFLLLGAALSMFALKQGITAQGDRLFPFIVMTSMPEWLQVVFLIALVSALLPSADGALTALTSSVCHDLLGFERGKVLPEQSRQIIRLRVHLAFAILLLGFVWVFRYMDQASMVLLILKLAAFTYGPLMGLFLFAAFSKQALAAGQVVLACGLSIVLSLTIDYFQATWFETWRIGLEILVINALICTSFLFVFTKKSFSQSGT